MKKFLTLATMLVMLFSVSLTANAAKSPKGEKVEEKPTTIVQVIQAAPVVSPKTGESDIALYGFGATAVVLATGAVIVRKKEMAA